jgi:hypothetical protein
MPEVTGHPFRSTPLGSSTVIGTVAAFACGDNEKSRTKIVRRDRID